MKKNYELRIYYANGEVDDYYSRLTGHYWETKCETPEEVLKEMEDYDSETMQDLLDNENVIGYEAIEMNER